MDVLTHIFLPLTLLYVVKRKLFNPNPAMFLLAGFAVLPDLDKYFGFPGLLHSIVILVPVILTVFLVEKLCTGSKKYTVVIAFFVFSHILLDFLGDGMVTPFYPFIRTGVSLQYPLTIVFGEGFLGATLRGPSIEVVKGVARPGFRAYPGLVSGFGVASLLLFVITYLHGSDRLPFSG